MSVAEVETPAETEAPTEPTEPTEPDAPTEPTEPEPEPEPVEPVEPPPPAVDPAEMEKILKKVDGRATTYRNAVADLLGDAILGFTPCPLCSDGIMGHIPPLEDAQPSTELEARLLEVLKTPSAPEYREAPNVRQCGTCAGWGSVLSGSRVAGKERVMCPTCKGNGFQGDLVANLPPQGTNGAVEYEMPDDVKPVASGDVDIWGSPRLLDDGQENPNFGKMIQYKNPALP
jgi:hypothetical protein